MESRAQQDAPFHSARDSGDERPAAEDDPAPALGSKSGIVAPCACGSAPPAGPWCDPYREPWN